MDKNSIIGFILIGVIMFGFSWYQSNEYRKQQEYQMELDSLAFVEQAETAALNAYKEQQDTTPETIVNITTRPDTAVANLTDTMIVASAHQKPEFRTISNEKLEIVFNTAGAQLFNVTVKDHTNYDGTPLHIFNPGASRLEVKLRTQDEETINTSAYNFVIDETQTNDSSIVMRLPFSNGGYIQQKYTLSGNSYRVGNELSFVGLEDVLQGDMSTFDLGWKVTIPRMEKGYDNELRYSKLSYFVSGDEDVESIAEGRDGEEQVDSQLKWFAFQQQFFSAIATSRTDFGTGNFSVKYFKEDDPSRNLMYCSADMQVDVREDNVYGIDLYFGPNDYKTLKSYGFSYEDTIPLGGWLVGWISKWVIIPVFDFLGKFISSYGIVILLLTLLIKLVISPLTIKSYMSSAKMSALKPEIDKLNEKYPKQEDAMKKQQAMMDLYSKAGISPMGGCLPMLLQFPILWAMFKFFPASIELRQQSFLWADDLSAYDSIWDLPFNIPLYGDHVSLFALLMAISMFLYSKMTSSQMSNDPSMAGMKFMSVWMMPIMMLFICNNLSSGLSYYYLLSNLITIVQTWVIRKYIVNEKKVLAEIQANASKPKKKSKWQMRLEEAQRMQEQMMKEQNKKNRRR